MLKSPAAGAKGPIMNGTLFRFTGKTGIPISVARIVIEKNSN
jgi:hypothetical protein